MTPKNKRIGSTQKVQDLEEMQRSLKELELALESVIEGWSHSLDLRTKETEGHIRRVSAMTNQLGVIYSFSEENLRFLHWGAMLHGRWSAGIPWSLMISFPQSPT
jgi:response regulator RpfG family c-di-GMP phosphodiesterase